ncbi:MAG TPA: hypothetical protein VL944_01900 [Candidatus Acidoferrum sp.]|nr:hypothetical protein [Candidatus Acidoferrum sp.]
MAKHSDIPDSRVLFIITYLVLWLSGLLVYLTEGQTNKRLRFHSLQAMFLGIITFVIAFIPVINILAWPLWILGLIIGAMAYNGNDVTIPMIGDYAKKESK